MSQLKGFFFGLLSSVCFGFIPLFTLPLMRNGLGNPSILFYRFLFASAALFLVLLAQRRSFKVSRSELVTLLYLALIYDGSALFLLEGYLYMPSGVATTIHFLYPVVTTLVMVFFYGEKKRFSTFLAVFMAVAGVAVLSYVPGGLSFSLKGVVIVLISAVCYALYIVRVNRSRVRNMSGLKLAFYVLFIGMFIFAADALRQGGIQPIPNGECLANFVLLGLVCTVMSNFALLISVKHIGSTLTSILGAMEPLTAVCCGALFYNEPFTLRVVAGMGLIIPAVIIIILGRQSKMHVRNLKQLINLTNKNKS